MSYENAVPKPLKFLISDGKMIDDAGNVIAESDTLKELYTKWEPEVKKYLLSDGSVVDEEGNLIVKNDYYKKIYDQAVPKVAKYLHSDGTVDENSGGSSANLQDNKSVNISSAGSVEIEPDNGYDGMKKVTANVTASKLQRTLTSNGNYNISGLHNGALITVEVPTSGGGVLMWKYQNISDGKYVYTKPNPTTSDLAITFRVSDTNSLYQDGTPITSVNGDTIRTGTIFSGKTYNKVGTQTIPVI